MRLTASYNPTELTGTFDVFADPAEAIVTDEHAACSYGQPVVVIDGKAHGPAELPCELLVYPESIPYAGDPAIFETTDEQRARYTPESLAFIERVRSAGFRVQPR